MEKGNFTAVVVIVVVIFIYRICICICIRISEGTREGKGGEEEEYVAMYVWHVVVARGERREVKRNWGGREEGGKEGRKETGKEKKERRRRLPLGCDIKRILHEYTEKGKGEKED